MNPVMLAFGLCYIQIYVNKITCFSRHESHMIMAYGRTETSHSQYQQHNATVTHSNYKKMYLHYTISTHLTSLLHESFHKFLHEMNTKFSILQTYFSGHAIFEQDERDIYVKLTAVKFREIPGMGAFRTTGDKSAPMFKNVCNSAYNIFNSLEFKYVIMENCIAISF